MKQFTRAVELHDSSTASAMNSDRCAFDIWYHGIGAARYDTHAGYPFVEPMHRRVHELAQSVVGRMSSGDDRQTDAAMRALRKASHHFTEAVRRLND